VSGAPGSRSRRTPKPRASTAAVFALLAIVGCRSAPAPEPVAPPPAGPRNLVLITIDTLRSDYVGYSGSGKVRTPNLDRLAREGVCFTETRSPVPMTLPAHASILTGELPPTHGVRVNGRDRLSEKAVTLAEILKSKGYDTAAFVGAFVLDRRYGLAQGFDVYDDDVGGDVGELESFEAERNAGAVASAFRGWLERQSSDRPLFVWLHFYDPHAPYQPPEPYRGQFPDDPYAGEVAYADAVVGQVVDELRSRGLLDGSLLAVVGDHGEGLGEHGEQTHSVLIYNSALHVPLLIRAPGLVEAGRRVDAVTRTVDVAPTLLDYLGFDAPAMEGRTLRPLVEGKSDGDETGRPVYSESLYASIHLGWSELRALERGGFRYIEAPRPELYDLGADPGERENVLLSRKAIAREMREELERERAALEKGAPHELAATDPATEARLKSLGYVSSSSAGRRSGGGALVDPKDEMVLWNQIQLGVHEVGLGRFDAGREILEKVLSTEKTVPIVYENLGEAYLRLGREAEAEALFRQALSRGIEEADFHVNLGRIYQSRRDLGRSENELRVALALDPMNVAALVHLGNTLRAENQPQEALPLYRKALEINPRYVYALDGLGRAESQLGRADEALSAFREVVRLDPDGAQGYFNLGVQLEHMGRKAEALESYQELLRRAGRDRASELTRRAVAAVDRLKAQSPSR
jgi:arylsulfatase A-like enzyme/Tfp pilus assembly protein PilF